MIMNLEIIRHSRSSLVKDSIPGDKESSPDNWVTPPTSPEVHPVRAEKGTKGRKRKGRKTKAKTRPSRKRDSPQHKAAPGGSCVKLEPKPSPPQQQLKTTPPKRRKRNKNPKQKLSSDSSHSPLLLLPAISPKCATPPSEKPSRKRQRSYSFSPSDSSLCIPHSAKHLKLDPIQVTDASAADEPPPFSPPSSTERQVSKPRKRKRNSTFVVSTSADLSDSGSTNGTPGEQSFERKRKLTYNKESPGGEDSEGQDLQDEQPLTKRTRRSTYEVSSHESSLVKNDSVRSRRSTYEVPSHESSLVIDDSGVGAAVVGEMGGARESDSEECDVKKELLSLLDKRVEERKADPNYKPMFTVSTTVSRIPVKSATAKKFEKAHQRQFNRMQSITSCYQAQVDRSKRLGNIVASSKKPKRPSLTALARASIRRSLTPRKSTLTSRKSVATGNKTSSNSASQFKPSVTSTKSAKFNFTSTIVSFQPSALKPQNRPRVESRVINRPKTPAAKTKPATSYSMKTPSKQFVFTGENKLSTKKPDHNKFNLQASLKRPKPSYKAYSGKVPLAGKS